MPLIKNFPSVLHDTTLLIPLYFVPTVYSTTNFNSLMLFSFLTLIFNKLIFIFIFLHIIINLMLVEYHLFIDVFMNFLIVKSFFLIFLLRCFVTLFIIYVFSPVFIIKLPIWMNLICFLLGRYLLWFIVGRFKNITDDFVISIELYFFYTLFMDHAEGLVIIFSLLIN